MRTPKTGRAAMAAALIACAASARAQTPLDTAALEKAFSDWSALASAAPVSPATVQAGDLVGTWTLPDGRAAKAVVKIPRPAPGTPTLTLGAVPAGADARPYFEAALAQARTLGASKLVIPRATYTFRSTSQAGAAHLLVEKLRDITIDGSGARLVFTQDADGIVIRQSQRLMLRNLQIDYALRTASLATSRVGAGGRIELVVDARFPVGSTDALHYVSEYDRATGTWVPGGWRVILPPETTTPASLVAGQVYTSSAFARLPAGRSFVLMHHWYGGAAVKVADSPGATQAEDIVVDGVQVQSGPGMGFVAYGMKRGYALINSVVAPRPDGSSPVSTEYDAAHVIHGGGDILILGNRFSGHGDDGLNLNNPVHPVVAIEPDGRTLTLGKYSRLIGAGDELAFFAQDGRYLGKARVTVPPVYVDALDHRVVLDRVVPGLDTTAVARDLRLLSSRYVVQGNVIQKCQCHGVLAQLPVGLIQRNTFRQLSSSAIRLLTDTGTWQEGVGAFNVSVLENTIDTPGIETAADVPWGAITAYGGTTAASGVATPVNKHVTVANNVVTNAPQGCVGIARTRSVSVAYNRCEATNLRQPGGASLPVNRARDIVYKGNRRSGTTTGGIAADAATVVNLTTQPDY